MVQFRVAALEFLLCLLLSAPEALASEQRCGLSLQAAAQINEILKANRFETDRRLLAASASGEETYEGLLGPDFIAQLRRLKNRSIWMDSGAGSFTAIADYFRNFFSPEKATAMGVTIELPDGVTLEPLYQNYPGKIVAYEGERLERLFVGRSAFVDLITDVFGPMNYSEKPDLVLQRYGEILKPGGRLYFLMSSKFSSVDKFETWLRSIRGLQLLDLRRDANPDTQVATMLRTAEPLNIPSLKLLEFKTTRRVTAVFPQMRFGR